MARRRNEQPDRTTAIAAQAPAAPLADLQAPAKPADAIRAVVLGESKAQVGELARVVRSTSQTTCDEILGDDEAIRAIAGGAYDAVVIRQATIQLAIQSLRRVESVASGARCVLCAPAPSVGDAVEAMRAGAVDLLPDPPTDVDLLAAVAAAATKARAERDQSRRIERLKRICRRLNTARQQVTSQVDVLCNDLVGAYRELADQVTHVSLASEFGSILQQELDVESLLRTSLEYLLTKTGPTNAAVFLPSNHTDFTLGAYVNYDCPRDTADVLLDHLSDVIAPRFQDETEVVRFDDAEELSERIGADANWLSDSRVIVFSCRHEGECLAVMTLFRDRATPFPDELVPQLKVMSDLFAKQLARVIRIHHRHLPDKQWTGFDSWDDDDEDSGRDGGVAA